MLSIHITVKLLVYICFVSLTLWDVLKRLPHHLPSMQQQQSKTGNNTIRGEYDGAMLQFLMTQLKNLTLPSIKRNESTIQKSAISLTFPLLDSLSAEQPMRTWLSAHNDTRIAPVRKAMI